MNSMNRERLVTRVCRFSLLAVMALGIAGISQAQAQSGSTKPAPASPKAAAPASQTTASSRSTGKGLGASIKVHGHWVIEIKNPDGKVVTHREFENSLSPGFTMEGLTLPGGASLLSALMSGQTMLTPPAWAILLEGPSFPNATNSPCAFGSSAVGACFLVQNSPTSDYAIDCSNPVPGLSCNVAVSPLGTSPNFTGFQLSGNIVVPNGGTIWSVATMDANVCGEGGTLANCVFTNSIGMVAFTSVTLDGIGTDPPVLPAVTAYQTIQVTVTISFQ